MRDGRRVEVSLTLSPIRDDQGRLIGVAKIARDIGDRKRAELALKESQERLVGIISSATDAIITIDEHQLITLFNAAAERMFNCPASEAIGQSLERFIPVRFQPAHRDHVRRFGETGVSARVMGAQRPLAALRADGSEFPVEATISQITVAGQKLYTAIVRDISERQRQEEALLESEGQLRAIVDTAVDGIITIDERGSVRTMNPAAERIFGYRADEVFGKNVHVLMPSPYHEEHDRYLADYRRTGVRKIIGIGREVVGRRKDGTTFPMDLAVSETVLGNRTVFTGIVRDISERKRAEAEREHLLASERAARSEAERVSRMKDEFLATLSHELRTPLNAIYGWSQLLQKKAVDDDELIEGLAVIARNARAQTKLIEDLLDMSRIISGKLRLDVQQLDLSDVIDAAVLAILPAAQAKEIRIHKVLDSEAGAVAGDPNRLQQIIWNLLSNAVKFTPKGGKVQVILNRSNAHVELSVSDTGEGIPPEFVPYLFERFRQSDASTTRRHAGLGLGLAIVKHLVELHGGTVRVRSTGVGQGSTFTVLLPLQVAPVEEFTDLRGESASLPRVQPRDVKLTGLRALVVDDEADARDLIRRLLEEAGALVVTAMSASEAFDRVQEEHPDVLVTDIGMPHEDGYSLVRRLRKLPTNEGGALPAIALTAFARAEDRTKALLSGFQAHVSKPVEPAELLAVVANVTGRV
jgi:PAS domain S-box-containing protein